MIEDCIILGGGAAGLSAANQLADAGMHPLIIDGGEYPCHRICGEYFSHECLPILQNWDVPLIGKISSVRFVKGNKKIEFSLPKLAGSCSHFDFDIRLLERALKKGARVLCKTTVQSLRIPSHSNETYELELSQGQTLKARHLMIGTGKLPKIAGMKIHVPEKKYLGLKAHFEGIDMQDRLEMHVFPGGYLGIANVNSKTTNIAALVKKKGLMGGQPNEIIQRILNEKSMSMIKKRIEDGKMILPKWLMGEIPEFGIRQNPNWERVFWIGDAAGGIPPVSGEGLAIAITSGSMGADYLLNRDWHQFKKDWLKRYRKRYFWAQVLHRGLMQPWINELGMQLFRNFPSLPLYAWQLTREDGFGAETR